MGFLWSLRKQSSDIFAWLPSIHSPWCWTPFLSEGPWNYWYFTASSNLIGIWLFSFHQLVFVEGLICWLILFVCRISWISPANEFRKHRAHAISLIISFPPITKLFFEDFDRPASLYQGVSGWFHQVYLYPIVL